MLLNEEFYRALREHPVPLSESALRAIGPRSMVIDTYIWLAYRLHALRKEVEVGWPCALRSIWRGVQAHPAIPVALYRGTSTRSGRLSRCARHPG